MSVGASGSFNDRAFDELTDIGVIDSTNHKEETIEYRIDAFAYANTNYAILENNVGYISWIWVRDRWYEDIIKLYIVWQKTHPFTDGMNAIKISLRTQLKNTTFNTLKI